MSSEWDGVADEWDDASTVRAYAAAAFESLLAVAATAGISLDGATACDFGCGTGLLTERLAERCATVDAVDTSPAMLAKVRAKIDVGGWSHVRTLDALPESDLFYDVVVCSSVLAFVDDHPATVADLATRLQRGGLFVQWDWEAATDHPDHPGLTRTAVEHALSGAGLAGGTVERAFTIEAEGEQMRPLCAWGVRQGDSESHAAP